MIGEDVVTGSSTHSGTNSTLLDPSIDVLTGHYRANALHTSELFSHHLDPSALLAKLKPRWIPTRLSSPFCVLSAYGFQDDFYINTLSWGHEQIALALGQDLLFFHPASPQRTSGTICIADLDLAKENYSRGAGSSMNLAKRQPTAVAIGRHSDNCCFLGLSGGGVELFHCREYGTVVRSGIFVMPRTPYENLVNDLKIPLFNSGSGAYSSKDLLLSRVSKAMSASMCSVSSVCAIATSETHPWLGVIARAGGELLTLDTRTRNVCGIFGGELNSSVTSFHPYLASPSLSPTYCNVNSYEGCRDQEVLSVHTLSAQQALRRLQCVSNYLKHHDRICSVAWSANGCLIATGSDMGTVKVWSLQNTSLPMQVISFDQLSTIKALSFHPHNPYELLIGGNASHSGLRVYNVLPAEPQLLWSTSTIAQTTQAQYSPDGEYILTAQGTSASPPTLPEMTSEIASGENAMTSNAMLAYREPRLQFNFADDDTDENLEVTSNSVREMERNRQARRWVGAVPSVGLGAHQHFPPSYSLVVWRKPKRDFVEVCPCELILSKESTRAEISRPIVQSRRRHCSCNKTSSSTLPLQFQYAMSGHRARPLLACPFSPSSYEGCVASVAGGADSNIRFWRVFHRGDQPGSRYNSMGEMPSSAGEISPARNLPRHIRELR